MRSHRRRRTARMEALLRSETRVHLLFEYVTRPDGTWVAVCGMPEAQAEGGSYLEARDRLRVQVVELMGTAAVRQATLVEDVPFGAMDVDLAY